MVKHIDLDENQEPDYVHPPFTGKRLADIERIKSILDPVYPLTIDQWQDTLRRDVNPDSELAWWVSFADVYRDYTAELPPDKCKEAFEHLLLMAQTPPASDTEESEDD